MSRALGGRIPVEHIVVILKENRTYDNYFGAFPRGNGQPLGGVCGWRANLCLPLYRRSASGRCTCHFTARDIPGYWRYAGRFTLADQCFSEVRGPSRPNHLMMMTGHAPYDPRCGAIPDLPTIADLVEGKGLTWKNYRARADAGLAMIPHLSGHPNQAWWENFAADATAGKLPHLSWLTPPFWASEHPPAPVSWGEAWTIRQINAVMVSPIWRQSVIFLVWDDYGGYADHVNPPVVERRPDGTPFRYGPRVPLLVIGPYARAGFIYERECSLLSVTRYIETIFDLGFLTLRDAQADDLRGCFDYALFPK